MANYGVTPLLTARVIDLPFSFSSGGAVASVDMNNAKAWKNKVYSVLLTARGSRVWYDRFGASIADSLSFENVNTLIPKLKESVSTAFIRWIPEVSLRDVLYNYEYSSGTLTVSVYYALPDGSEDTLTISQSLLTPSGNTLQVGYDG